MGERMKRCYDSVPTHGTIAEIACAVEHQCRTVFEDRDGNLRADHLLFRTVPSQEGCREWGHNCDFEESSPRRERVARTSRKCNRKDDFYRDDVVLLCKKKKSLSNLVPGRK